MKTKLARTSIVANAVLLVVLHAACGVTAADLPADGDRDGIPDLVERQLGSDPEHAEPLQVVLNDGAEAAAVGRRPEYDPSKDVEQVEFCHVGDDRYLWRVQLAAAPRLDDTVLHLYVDADADQTTGRKVSPGAPNHGTEYMLSVVGGRGRSTWYDADGNSRSGPPVTFAVQDRAVWISADVDLKREAAGVRYDLYVLCHTITDANASPRMSDSTPKRPIAQVPVSKRPKIMRPSDYTKNFRVQATFGMDILRSAETDADNVVVPHDRLQTDGFVVDDQTSRRWPHLRREAEDARAWAAAPKAGRYHVGFMLYDDSSDERIAIFVDGILKGVAVAGQNDNQTWLYWLEESLAFAGGEKIELQAVGSGGKHGICNLLFLAREPEVRKLVGRVENMAVQADFVEAGTVTLSWTTTWPCPTRLEYGSERDGELYRFVEAENTPCLVHRVVLQGLDPAIEYHARAVGLDAGGQKFSSEDFPFRAVASAAPAGRVDKAAVPLRVTNPHPFPLDPWPINTGIPFPEGHLASAENVRLMGSDGEVPLQAREMARWRDGSIKWVLLSFLVSLPAEEAWELSLEFGRTVRRQAISGEPIVRREDGAQDVTVDTGSLSLRIDRHGNLTDLQADGQTRLPADKACLTRATDAAGISYDTGRVAAQIEIEETGPLRGVVKVVSQLRDERENLLLEIEKRITAYRGVSLLNVAHTLLIVRPERFTEIDSLTWHLPLAAAGDRWEATTEADIPLVLDAAHPSVCQRLDDQLVCGGDQTAPWRKGRLAGGLIGQAERSCAVAVRDCWQNYPKGFAVGPDGVEIQLLPEFADAKYDEFDWDKEGHHLYYYLQNGRYRLKRGLAKTHEMLLTFAAPATRQRQCAAFQQPPLAIAPPRWHADSKAFYDIAPRDPQRFGLYEQAIDRNLAAYTAARERQRDFGLMNYGDWYGERGTNWGNVEYDTQHALFLEFVRSGNPQAFSLGAATELHNRDIDTVQPAADRDNGGAVYIHQMCHVGDYYDRSVPGSLGFPSGGYSISHAWTEGHFDHYFLTGDRRSLEIGRAVADYFIRKELGRPYDFSSCRTPGWHLIMLASAYAATNDPYYLNAAKVVVRRVLETQDVPPRPLPDYQAEGRKPYQLGGWSRMMVPGHCHCHPRHRGNAGFMVAILLSGLKYYHDVTGDPAVKEAIIRGAYSLLDETYSDQVHGFRYTSCPHTQYSPGASPLMVEGIARAYVWTGDERFRRVLTDALPRGAGGSSYGKGFSMYYRMAPRVLADLEAAGLSLNYSPAP